MTFFQLKTLSDEHHSLKYQYRSLDKAAEDVLGILVTDKYYDTVVQGLTVLREAIISMQVNKIKIVYTFITNIESTSVATLSPFKWHMHIGVT